MQSLQKKPSHEMGLLVHEKAPRSPPSWTTGNYQINWLSTGLIAIPPLLVLGAFFAGVEFQYKTFWLAVFCYWFNGFGISVGYHRLFSHCAFQAHWTLQWLLAFMGAGAFEGSIKWWCRNHRIHHRYIDTDKDPYNAKRGFFYTHIGWMIMKQDYEILGRVDCADFKRSKMITFQHEHYLPIGVASGILMPTIVAGLGWGDWLGGYFYAGLLKMVILHHCTFFINSLAHTSFAGATQNFSDKHSSFDSAFCALFTLGEGYHNFHHEFAQDYRNGVMWYHFDPTKWLIRVLEIVGLARNLVRTPNAVIQRNRNALSHKQHMEAADRLTKRTDEMNQATAVDSEMTWDEINAAVNRGKKLMVIADNVLDLEKAISVGTTYTQSGKRVVWYNAHPGGRKILDMYVGKDATEAFHGGVYAHHEGAINLLPYLTISKLKR